MTEQEKDLNEEMVNEEVQTEEMPTEDTEPVEEETEELKDADEAEESEELTVQEEENSAVQWWSFEDVLKVSEEPWMVENIYKKLIERSR